MTDSSFFHYFFFLTGIITWLTIALLLGIPLFITFCYLYDSRIQPIFRNLRFALFARPKSLSFYEEWSKLPSWHYLYYTRGQGNKNFARCATRRLVLEARKESLKKRKMLTNQK